MLLHFIPQNSLPRPVGTGDREASLAPLSIYKYIQIQDFYGLIMNK